MVLLLTTTMGACARILATRAMWGKKKTAVALNRRPLTPIMSHRVTPGDALPTTRLFMSKSISARPTLYGTSFTASRRCACVRRLRRMTMQSVVALSTSHESSSSRS